MTHKDCHSMHEILRIVLRPEQSIGVFATTHNIVEYEYVWNKKFYVNKPMYFDRAVRVGDVANQTSGSLVAVFLAGGNLDSTYKSLQVKVSSVLTFEDL